MTSYYPPGAFSFSVWIDGTAGVDAGFAEVSGLSSEWEVVELREGGVPAAHQVPGRVKVGPLSMSRGLMLAPSPLFAWCTEVLESTLSKPITPRDITVALLGPEGLPLIAWNVVRAWPMRWTIDAFKADQSAVAMEKIEFACSEVTRTVVTPLPRGGLAAHAG